MEVFLQIMGVVAAVWFINPSVKESTEAVSMFNIVSLFRMLRILDLLTEIPHFKVILNTYLKFAAPFVTMMCSLYTVFYIFAQFGMLFFGGLITTESAQVND
jgi:hypothetical protein